MKNHVFSIQQWLLPCLMLMAGTGYAQDTRLLRQPALSAEHLAFVYAGDIWLADRNGDNPRRLTSHPAEENSPSFSPDGTQIAYMGSYENNRDVYLIDIAGGQPQRLTWHPGADNPMGWSADGSEIAFVSGRESDHGRSGQLYHVNVNGGFPEKQMLARITAGQYAPDGEKLAYIDHGTGYNGLFGGSAGWKGYRGGTTPDIRIMDIQSNSVVVIDGAAATNFNPIWLGEQLYFLSDRNNKTFNLFHYSASTSTLEQVSTETNWDIRAAGGYGDSLVYEAGGQLKILNTNSGQTQVLEIDINPDLPQLRPKWKNASNTITDASLSATGKRVVINARGDVFTVPVEDGSSRNLTGTDGQREYGALWSPDGEQVAYLEESLNGQTLVLTDQTGNGDGQRFSLGEHFYQLMAWTPGDTSRIVYQDNHLGLHVINLENGNQQEIAHNVRREAFEISVSPDGNWLAYTLEQPNFHRQLMLYNFNNNQHTPISESTADVAAPAFSHDGKLLVFAASTNSGPLQIGLNMTSQERPYRAGLYALVLSDDGESPLLADSGDEISKDEDTDSDGGDKKESEAVDTDIDLDGISNRIVGLPVAERNYDSLAVANDGKLYFIERTQPGISNEVPGSGFGRNNRLMRFDFSEKETDSLKSGVQSFSLSANGKVALLQTSGGKLETAEIGKKLETKSVDVNGLRVLVDPRNEWAQIFDEAWRMEKEYFYADTLHGLDWDAVYSKFKPLLKHVGRREDLNALMVEMIAELQAGHNRVGGGDVHRESRTSTGLLGANFVINNGRYQIGKIYTGEDWNTFLEAPLASPGNTASEGEYILAINGQELTADQNIFALLQNTEGERVILQVGPNANGRDIREIIVKPVSNENALRLWSWVESNRKAVAAATNNEVGYIYLPNTAGAGYTFFNRMFFSQVDKKALIIDERSNGGGQAANYITDVLSRQHLSGWKDRDGLIYNTPAGAVHGPKVMMIDQDAGSGGDFLPYSFRQLGIGKLIGTRTWGGLIGISTNPGLIDGGSLTVPFFRFFDTQGNWTIENEGIAPDIEIELDPIATNNGRDTQLEKAISEIQSQLSQFRPTVLEQAPTLPTEVGE